MTKIDIKKIKRARRIYNCLNKAILLHDNDKIEKWQQILIKYYDINYYEWKASRL